MVLQKKKSKFATRNVATNNNNAKLLKLIARSRPEDLHIAFEHYDGSSRQLNMNKTFVLDEKGKKLRPLEILKKLNTLKHDFGAKSMTLTNLSR